MSEYISDQRMEAALHFLAETDEQFAAVKADHAKAEIYRKRIRAKVSLLATGTATDRQARAETDPETIAADEEFIIAITALEQLKARRERAMIVIEVWRSINANRRRV